MRRALLASIWLALLACDKDEAKRAEAKPDAAPAPALPDAAPTASTPRPPSSYVPPPRPVPSTVNTVTQGMPEMVQLQAIQYMESMSAPRPDDANADPDYAAQIAEQLKPVSLSFDKGSPGDKSRMNRVEVTASGRKIDLRMAGGCADTVPSRALARIGAQPSTLLMHGVLVVRCLDDHSQCLQSTRNEKDVLCTTVPRKK